MSNLVSTVVDVALYIQKHYSQAESKIGLRLTSLCGVSIGPLNIHVVGDPLRKVLFCGTGEVVSECLTATSYCNSGNVVVSLPIWQHINPNKDNYKFRILSNGFVRLNKDMGFPVWEEMNTNDTYAELEFLQANFMPKIMACIHPLPSSASTTQQLDILSCMSQVSVGALLVRDMDLTGPNCLQAVTVLLINIIKRYDGVISRILFEEGIIYGVYFGSPGFKHLDDPVRCLLWANEVVRALKDIGFDSVARLATGMCFSGILGSTHRLETAIFGKPVYSVLTLVHHFYDVPVICCINTVLRSRRELGDIFEQMTKKTRGLKNIPICYSINFSLRQAQLPVKCVGRDAEKVVVLSSLSELKNEESSTADYLPLILVVGEIGAGKTNFLKWIIQASNNLGFGIKCNVTTVAFEESFERAWHIVKDVLVSRYVDSESSVLELLGDDANNFPLHLLNKYLNTKFPVSKIRQENLLDLQKDMLVALIKGCAKGVPLLIVLDDGENIESNTWYFFQDLLITRTACMVITYTEPLKPSKMPLVNNILKQRYKTITLGPLTKKDIVSLACTFLDVVAIHKNFVNLLVDNSEGNPLRLQEVLLLPQLQRHFCLVGYNSIVQTTLEKAFSTSEDGGATDLSDRKVCDVLDPDGLKAVFIPAGLLDVVKEHTSGLAPEEQMFVKKCACLGDHFGLYLLQVVCPEYTSTNLRISIRNLVKKNLLALGCKHLKNECWGIRESIQLTDIPEEFCSHPLTFTSEYLRKCINNFMPQGQKERLHLFIFSLLKDAKIICDSCQRCAGSQTVPAYMFFPSDYEIPRFDMSYCHCINFKLTVYTQIDYHLKEGNAPATRRIKYLLKGAEVALAAESESKMEVFLATTEKLISFQLHNYPVMDDFSPVLAKASLKRLEAEAKLLLGEEEDAMDFIVQALALLGKDFPSDYLKSTYNKKALTCCQNVVWNMIMTKKDRTKHTPVELKEVSRCLAVGCLCLIYHGKFNDAYLIAKIEMIMLLKLQVVEKNGKFPTLPDITNSRNVLLTSGSKTRKHSIRRTQKWFTNLLELCHTRLVNPFPLDLIDLKAIVRAYTNASCVLFEKNDLENAVIVGSRVFQIIKILRGKRELTRAVPYLGLIYFYQKNLLKCFEILNQLLEVSQQIGDIMAEAIYYCMIVKALRCLESVDIKSDKIKMCNEFAMSKTADLLPTKNKNKKFWVTALMSLWCFEKHLEEPFRSWYSIAANMKEECSGMLNNFWSLSASITLLIINIGQVYNRSLKYAGSQASTSSALDRIQRNLFVLEDNATKYVPVLLVDIHGTRRLIEKILRRAAGHT